MWEEIASPGFRKHAQGLGFMVMVAHTALYVRDSTGATREMIVATLPTKLTPLELHGSVYYRHTLRA